MGYGSWTRESFERYSTARGRKVDSSGALDGGLSNQEIFKARQIDPMLDPRNVMRECLDSPEHPETLPVILALDVTGSMGQAAVEVARQLNVIMSDLYDKVRDVEFMVMGIGDLECDAAPIQISQFESDIRIADQLERIYFEFGGGGNAYESYTAAWYMAARHTRLDCLARGRRGILITMGDEPLNPYLPLHGQRTGLAALTGDNLQADVETGPLYRETLQKYDIYHLNVIHYSHLNDQIRRSFLKYLDREHYREVPLNGISAEITGIITAAATGQKPAAEEQAVRPADNVITWDTGAAGATAPLPPEGSVKDSPEDGGFFARLFGKPARGHDKRGITW